jgi:class 3 adenylate cyclase
LEHGQYLAEHIEGAEFVEISGADTYPYFENPDATIEALEAFLTDASDPTRADRLVASLLFTDIVDSTSRATDLGDLHWKALLDLHDRASRQVAESFGGRIVKNTGDGVLAIFDGPGRAIRAAVELRKRLADSDLPIRAGIHTGEVELRGDDVSGIAVHLAARVMAESESGELLVTSTVRDLVAGSGMVFADRGEHALKGIEEARRLYSVEPGSSPR